MAFTDNPEEYIAALGNLTPLMRDEIGGMQGVDNLNQYTRPGSGYNIPNGGLGGFFPTTDSSYSSGQNYARSIAGGMPMSQIMAPGVSYSPGDPTGYTQQQLNAPMQAPIPPKQEFREPDDTSFLGTGIGGYSMPFDRKQQLPPVEKIFGNIPSAPAQTPDVAKTPGLDFGNIDIEAIRQQIADSGIDFTNLFGLPSQPDLSQFVTQQDLPVYNQPDLSQFVTQQDLPAFNPQDYRDDFLSIAREGIDIPQFDASGLQSQIAQNKNLITGMPAFNPQDYRDDFLSIAREGIEMPSYEQPDLSSFAKLSDIPTFDPSGLQDRLNTLESRQSPVFNPQDYRDDFLSIAREGIEMPSFDPSGLQQQISALKQQPGFDPSALQNQISELQQKPGFDSSGLLSQIGEIQEQIGGINQFDPSGLQKQIEQNQNLIAGMPKFDPQNYRDDFLSIAREGIDMPQFDPSGLQQQIKQNQNLITGMPQFDPSGLQQQIGGLEQQISSMPQFNPQDYRDDFLSIAREGIEMPQYQAPDLSGFAKLSDIPQVNLAGYAKLEDLPQFDPQNYRDDFLSIARQGIDIPQYEAPDLSGFAKLTDIPSFDPSALKQDILSSLPQQAAPDLSGFMTQEDINKAISGINMPQYQAPDLSGFMTQEDINKAISGINMPSYEQPDLSGYDTRLADLEKTLLSLQQPVANDRFSVNQLNPRGLF